MKKGTLILIGIAVVLIIWAFSGYNSLVSLNERVDGQWAQVESQYQRRFDLIPNLVNAVEASMRQEREVFTAIADARSRYAGATTPDERAQAAGQIEGALARLLVVMENYPQLRSSEAVQNLMVQLEGTENRISTERMRYNEGVRDYNTTIQRFPKNILAAVTGFDERTYFEATNGAENAPEVNVEFQ